MTADEQAKLILRGLFSQDFFEWYKEDFEKFVNCDFDCKVEVEILKDIKDMFRLKD